jgi:hypothetical protein
LLAVLGATVVLQDDRLWAIVGGCCCIIGLDCTFLEVDLEVDGIGEAEEGALKRRMMVEICMLLVRLEGPDQI